MNGGQQLAPVAMRHESPIIWATKIGYSCVCDCDVEHSASAAEEKLTTDGHRRPPTHEYTLKRSRQLRIYAYLSNYVHFCCDDLKNKQNARRDDRMKTNSPLKWQNSHVRSEDQGACEHHYCCDNICAFSCMCVNGSSTAMPCQTIQTQKESSSPVLTVRNVHTTTVNGGEKLKDIVPTKLKYYWEYKFMQTNFAWNSAFALFCCFVICFYEWSSELLWVGYLGLIEGYFRRYSYLLPLAWNAFLIWAFLNYVLY